MRESDVRTLLDVGAADAVCLVEPAVAWVRELSESCSRIPLIVVIEPEKLSRESGAYLGAGAIAVLPSDLAIDTWREVVARLRRQTPPPASLPRAILQPAPRPPSSADIGFALSTLRDFSRLLGYSLNQESLVEHFIERLRELLGVSRVAIYLQSESSNDLGLEPVDASARRYYCAGCIGMPTGVAQTIALTSKGGLGRALTMEGAVIRASQALDDARAQHELETLGCSYALSVCDREGVIGIAVLGGVIAKDDLCDQQLQLAFHLLEQLGQAVRNSQLHARLAGQHRLIKNVLDGLYAGVVVFNSDLQVVYTNTASVRLLQPKGDRMAFALLQKEVADRVYQAVEHRLFPAPFIAPPTTPGGQWLRYTLIPLSIEPTQTKAVATMLVVEDHTPVRAAEKSAADNATNSTITLLAERFAHEVRNSLTAIMAHGQMLDEAFDRPDFRQSMKLAIEGEGRRIGRLTQQLLLLATPVDAVAQTVDRVMLPEVLQKAFETARSQGDGTGQLVVEADQGDWGVIGPRARLIHAFSEIFLNSLQMRSDPSIVVTLRREGKLVRAAIRDTGPGFSTDVAARALEPFYTTRTVGIGIGLTVAANIFGAAGGGIAVHPRNNGIAADLVVTLPAGT